MSDTPKTDAVAKPVGYFLSDKSLAVYADFARELERELATQKRINMTMCEEWASDHTHLQELCVKAGIPREQTEADENGGKGIDELADMLFAKLTDKQLA